MGNDLTNELPREWLQGTLPEIKADKHIKVIMFCYLVRLVDKAGVQIDCDRRGKWIGRGGNGELQKNLYDGKLWKEMVVTFLLGSEEGFEKRKDINSPVHTVWSPHWENLQAGKLFYLNVGRFCFIMYLTNFLPSSRQLACSTRRHKSSRAYKCTKG